VLLAVGVLNLVLYLTQNLTLIRMADYALPARQLGVADSKIEPVQLGTRRPFGAS
jgi:hypothetical protein